MKRILPVLLVAASIGLPPRGAAAQGFGVYEHGTCTMGRAGTGVAAPCADGSAMLFNPAGLARMGRGVLVSGGVTVIDARGDFTTDYTGDNWTLQNDPIPVPHLYLAYGASDKLALGVGVLVPYGLGTKWDSVTFEGRFNGYNNDLRSIYIQPTVAYQVTPKIALGAGFDVVLGSVELNQFLDLSEFPVPGQPVTFGQLGIPFRTAFAHANVTAKNQLAFGGHAGALVDLTDRLHFGVRYLLPVTIDYKGEATFNPVATNIVLPPFNPISLAEPSLPDNQPLPLDVLLGAANLYSSGRPLASQGGNASITMPGQLVAGLAWDASDRLRVLADYQFTQWSAFDTLTLDFEQDPSITPDRTIVENYRDTHGARVGFEYASSDRLTLRGGYLYHTAAAPPETVTPLLPEGARNEFTAGIGYQVGPSVHADIAYQFIRQNERRGRVREAPSGQAPSVDLNSGLYSFFAHLVGLTLTVRF